PGALPTALVPAAPRSEAQVTAQPQATAPVRSGSKQMQPADLKAWKSIRQSVLSSDGRWFAYVLAPNEGPGNVVIRATSQAAKEMSFPIGEQPSGAGRGGPPGPDGAGAGGGAPLVITPDSRWAAFTVYPAQAGRGAGGGRGGRGGTGGAAATPAASYNKMALVNLATGEKKEFDKVRRFAFNGDKPGWLAMQGYPDAPDAAAGAGAAAGRGAGATPAPSRAEGTDLVLYNLSSGEMVNVGNVAEFGFDDSGEWLAYTIDARDQVG